MKLAIIALSALLAFGCAKDSSTGSGASSETPSPSSDETPIVAPAKGLIGSVWTGDGQSGDGILNYVFQFKDGAVTVESTCQVAEGSSTLKSDLSASYSEDGKSVQLRAGVQSKIPTGLGYCNVSFPAGLLFQLDHDHIFIEYAGTRRLTKMKRRN